jgi:hypothetical protein
MRGIGLLFLISILAGRGHAFEVLPALHPGGQALEIRCRSEEAGCRWVCAGALQCVLPEAPCPRCAGTGDLRLKKILDSVGVGLRARPPERSRQDLMHLLAEGGWITLHPRTLYNFSSPWNGEAIRRRFRLACDAVSPRGAEALIFLRVKNESPEPGPVLGILCREGASGEASWWGAGQ